MAKTDSVKILVGSTSTAEKLAEVYSEVEGNIAKGAISSILKTKRENLEGDPQAGSVVVRRLGNATIRDEGTARTAGEGDKLRNFGVTVNLDQRKEIVEEVNYFDNAQFGVDELISKRAQSYAISWASYFDRQFFEGAEAGGTELVLTASAIEEQIEQAIQAIETVENSNVDGVDRSRIHLILQPEVYGKVQNKVNTYPNPVGGGIETKTLNGANVWSSHRMDSDMIVMMEEAVAQPIAVKAFGVQEIPLSGEEALSMFTRHGVKVIDADLVRYVDLDNLSV
jgi:hypothetical protein